MNGYEYEHFCAEKLKKLGYYDISVTQASNDQGIDIIAYKHGRKYGVQCKYYEKPVGNEAVQQAFTGSAYYGCDFAVVMTNTTFTRSALNAAEETEVILYEHIEPPQKERMTKSQRYLGLFLFILSSGFIAYYSLFSKGADALIYQNMIILALSVCMLVPNAFTTNTSLFLTILSIMLALFIPSSIPPYISILLWGMLLLVQLIACLPYWKERKLAKKQRNQEIENEKKEEEILSYIELLQDEFQCTIRFQKHEAGEDTERFYFSSSKNMQKDFALEAYSWNQKAEFEQLPYHYSFIPLTARTFIIEKQKTK